MEKLKDARCMGHRKFIRQCLHCKRLVWTLEDEDATLWIEPRPELKFCGRRVEE